jgi:hypothetical protein
VPKVKQYWSNLIRTPFRKMKLGVDDPNVYVGRTILAQPELGAEPEEVTIQHVVGCVAPHLNKYFQINGTHFCHMFSFFKQVLENRLPTKEENDEFELASQITKIRDIK